MDNNNLHLQQLYGAGAGAGAIGFPGAGAGGAGADPRLAAAAMLNHASGGD
jgi:hypothetical protein